MRAETIIIICHMMLNFGLMISYYDINVHVATQCMYILMDIPSYNTPGKLFTATPSFYLMELDMDKDEIELTKFL